MLLHPDDEGFDYNDGFYASHLNVYGPISSYREALIIAGADLPEDCAAEAAYWAEQDLISSLREPAFHPYCDCVEGAAQRSSAARWTWDGASDACPF